MPSIMDIIEKEDLPMQHTWLAVVGATALQAGDHSSSARPIYDEKISKQ